MKKTATIILVAIIILCAMPFVSAQQSFTLLPTSVEGRGFSLLKGENVTVTLNVSGGSANDTTINFRVADPTGKTIENYDHIKSVSFSFAAQLNGTYTLYFDNSFSHNNKTVTYDYFIQSPGSNQLLNSQIALAVTVIVLSVIIIALFAIAEHRYDRAKSKPSVQNLEKSESEPEKHDY